MDIDKSSIKMWLGFFLDAGVPSDASTDYAISFHDNRIRQSMLPDLSRDLLRDLGVSVLGDSIAILKHAKRVAQQDYMARKIGSSDKSAANGTASVPAVSKPSSSTSGNKSTAPRAALSQSPAPARSSRLVRDVSSRASPSPPPKPARSVKPTIDVCGGLAGDVTAKLALYAAAANVNSSTSTAAHTSTTVHVKRRRVNEVSSARMKPSVGARDDAPTYNGVSKTSVKRKLPTSTDTVSKRTVFDRLGSPDSQVSSTTATCADPPASRPDLTSPSVQRVVTSAGDVHMMASSQLLSPRFTVTGLGDQSLTERQPLAAAAGSAAAGTTRVAFLSNVLRRSLPRSETAALQYRGVLKTAGSSDDTTAADSVGAGRQESQQRTVTAGTLVSDRLCSVPVKKSVKQRISVARASGPGTARDNRRDEPAVGVSKSTGSGIKSRLGNSFSGGVSTSSSRVSAGMSARTRSLPQKTAAGVFSRLGR